MFTIDSILHSGRSPPSPPSQVKEWLSAEGGAAAGAPSKSPSYSPAVPSTSSSFSSSSSSGAAVPVPPSPPALVPATPLLPCVSPAPPCLSLTPSLLSSVSQLLDFSALIPGTTSFAPSVDTSVSSASAFHSAASAFVPISASTSTALPMGAASCHSPAHPDVAQGKTTACPHQRLALPAAVSRVPSVPLAPLAPSRSQTPFVSPATSLPHALHTPFTPPAGAIHTVHMAHLPCHGARNTGYASHSAPIAPSPFAYAPLGPVPSPAARAPSVLALPLTAPDVDFTARMLLPRPPSRPPGVAEVFEASEKGGDPSFPPREARRSEVEEHLVRSFHPHYFAAGYLPPSYPLGLQGVSVASALRTKVRRRYTGYQTKQLEKWFEEYKYITPQTRKIIACELDLRERQVKTWFQNRRAKEKRRRASVS
ncbi:vegetative cell wall protein gp1-like [Penaeus monodon]|uniref:vegetative cell wall protein gp1-like n=1 Tax=Penaeus monodon TaxID=6687 RepID=UPI0018A77B6B|nr:vegetative cell wall protein gp1-like [Penaeus monodon]